MYPLKQQALATHLVLLSIALLSSKGLIPSGQITIDVRQKSDQAFDFSKNSPDGLAYFYEPAKRLPAAEDVLVQRIPGDDGHLILMAYYSKENCNANFIRIDSWRTDLIFRDDGIGNDKSAGDGIYTALIETDAKAFRKEAAAKSYIEEKESEFLHKFAGRQMVFAPGSLSFFDLKKFDGYQPVSIASLGTANKSVTDMLQSNSLIITDLSVIEDTARTWNPCTKQGNPEGAWTFKHLMRQLASTDPAHIVSDAELSDFVLDWFGTWDKMHVINDDTLLRRPLFKRVLTKPWLERSKAAGFPDGQVDLNSTPFKLLAIVNRFDQRNTLKGKPAGEARFVFTLISNDCTEKKLYTFAIEYAINVPDDCSSLHDYARQWYDLKDNKIGSSEYNAALEAITNKFVLCGTNPEGVHQSCFASLRVNDQALTSNDTPKVGEFREFLLNPATHRFELTTISNVPADRFNKKMNNADTKLLADFVNENRRNIMHDDITIPVIYKGVPFRGAKTSIIGGVAAGEPPLGYYWDGTKSRGSEAYIANNEARHKFAMLTCSGCHAAETQTHFWHVKPVFFGEEASLSGFLQGREGRGDAIDFDYNSNNDSMTVKDAALRPRRNPTMRVFNDMLRRADDLYNYVNTPCNSIFKIRNDLMFRPLNSVH